MDPCVDVCACVCVRVCVCLCVRVCHRAVLDFLKVLVVDEYDECFKVAPEAMTMMLSCACNNNVAHKKPQVRVLHGTHRRTQTHMWFLLLPVTKAAMPRARARKGQGTVCACVCARACMCVCVCAGSVGWCYHHPRSDRVGRSG